MELIILSWYRGYFTFGKRSLLDAIEESKKDYHFRPRNKKRAEKTVISFVYSDQVKKDRRFYCPCRVLYERYCDYCQQHCHEPLGNRQFKQNMELLGFVYQKHHRFYAGYYSNKVTTAYKNIGLVSD